MSLYRTDSLKTVARELGKRKIDGKGEALNGQRIIHVSMENGVKIKT
jgi:hypothetical protein